MDKEMGGGGGGDGVNEDKRNRRPEWDADGTNGSEKDTYRRFGAK